MAWSDAARRAAAMARRRKDRGSTPPYPLQRDQYVHPDYRRVLAQDLKAARRGESFYLSRPSAQGMTSSGYLKTLKANVGAARMSTRIRNERRLVRQSSKRRRNYTGIKTR